MWGRSSELLVKQYIVSTKTRPKVLTRSIFFFSNNFGRFPSHLRQQISTSEQLCPPHHAWHAGLLAPPTSLSQAPESLEKLTIVRAEEIHSLVVTDQCMAICFSTQQGVSKYLQGCCKNAKNKWGKICLIGSSFFSLFLTYRKPLGEFRVG